MEAKRQIWILAGTTIATMGLSAYFLYKNYSVKNQLASWYKGQNDATRNSLPKEIQDMLNKAIQ
jgi:hypothetical protein